MASPKQLLSPLNEKRREKNITTLHKTQSNLPVIPNALCSTATPLNIFPWLVRLLHSSIHFMGFPLQPKNRNPILFFLETLSPLAYLEFHVFPPSPPLPATYFVILFNANEKNVSKKKSENTIQNVKLATIIKI